MSSAYEAPFLKFGNKLLFLWNFSAESLFVGGVPAPGLTLRKQG